MFFVNSAYDIGVCEINTRLDRPCLLSFGPAPLTSKLMRSYATAAYNYECLFHSPVALDFRMRMSIDNGARGESNK